jgi:hypothetical protein
VTKERIITIAAALVASGALASSAQAAAGPERSSCSAEKKAAKKASGAARKAAQRRLAACQAANRANQQVFDALKNSRLTGTRGDGATVDWLFCANGRYELATTSDGSTGRSTGTTWRVQEATAKGTTFEAVIADPTKGTEVAVGRKGAQWLAAVAWTPYEWGNVTRSDATADCG